MNEFEIKVAGFIDSENLLNSQSKVLLAVSGGADSTALLYVINSLKEEGRIEDDICCAHINHQLRGNEAQRDEDFVSEQCEKLGLALIIRKIDVRKYARGEKLSIETAARKLRIGSLLEIAKERNCSCIATAHHKNDNAETIVQRMSRGTGFRGLCGIWPFKEFNENIKFIRPLLCVSRQQIIGYLEQKGIKWCEDRTNLDCYYRRNFIRNRLIPYLQNESNDNIVEHLGKLSKAAQGFHKNIIQKADELWEDAAVKRNGGISLDVNIFAGQHNEVKIEVIRRVLIHFKTGEQDITQKHYEDILKLKDGSKIQIPGSLIVSMQGEKIIFNQSQKTQYKTKPARPAVLNIPGKTLFGNISIEAVILDFHKELFEKFKAKKTSHVEWFDLDKVKLPVSARNRKNGDKFLPLGLAGEKRIGKFITASKIPAGSRQKLFVIEDKNKIIWLYPIRLSEEAKVTSGTKKILQLVIKRLKS